MYTIYSLLFFIIRSWWFTCRRSLDGNVARLTSNEIKWIISFFSSIENLISKNLLPLKLVALAVVQCAGPVLNHWPMPGQSRRWYVRVLPAVANNWTRVPCVFVPWRTEQVSDGLMYEQGASRSIVRDFPSFAASGVSFSYCIFLSRSFLTNTRTRHPV